MTFAFLPPASPGPHFFSFFSSIMKLTDKHAQRSDNIYITLLPTERIKKQIEILLHPTGCPHTWRFDHVRAFILDLFQFSNGHDRQSTLMIYKTWNDIFNEILSRLSLNIANTLFSFSVPPQNKKVSLLTLTPSWFLRAIIENFFLLPHQEVGDSPCSLRLGS